SDVQKAAVRMALTQGVSLLTGRPGSGKTTTLRVFVDCCRVLGWTVRIAAPTGKAASRAAEVTKCEASTIHRLLGGSPSAAQPQSLKVDVLVVDEFSMVGLASARWVLQSVTPGTRLLIVGDPAQLPSVEHGAVLRDLVEADAVPAVHLNEVFRQAAESP